MNETLYDVYIDNEYFDSLAYGFSSVQEAEDWVNEHYPDWVYSETIDNIDYEYNIKICEMD